MNIMNLFSVRLLGLSLLLIGAIRAEETQDASEPVKSAKSAKPVEKKSQPAVTLVKEGAKADKKTGLPAEVLTKVGPLKTVNSIAVIIYTDDNPIIITKLDLDRPSLDGRKRDKEEVMLERLLYHEATVVFRMNVPDDMINKHIASIKEIHGLTEEQIAELFGREGYTFDEGKHQLKMSYAIQQLEQQLIMSRMVVTEEEIKQFYDQNPLKENAAYRIQKSRVSKKIMSEGQVRQLEQDGEGRDDLSWSNPYWLEHDEIATSKEFIKTMEPGQIRAIDAGDEYEIIMLLKRKREHIKSLDESRRDIADHIRMTKYQKLLQEFHESILKKYEVVDFTK